MSQSPNVHTLRHVYKGQYVKVYTDDINFELGVVVNVAAAESSSLRASTSGTQRHQDSFYQQLLRPQHQQPPSQHSSKPSSPYQDNNQNRIITVQTLTGFTLTVPLSKLRRAFLVILDLNGVLGCRVVTKPMPTHTNGVIQLSAAISGGQVKEGDNTFTISPAEAVQVTPTSSFVARPNLAEFLTFLFKNFIVGVWTSGEMRNAVPIIDFLFGPDQNNGVDYRKRLLFTLFRSDTTGRPTPEKPFATIKDLDLAVFSKYVAELPEDESAFSDDTARAMRVSKSSGDLFSALSAGADLPAAPKSGGNNVSPSAQKNLVSLFHVGNTVIIDDSADKCSHPDNALCPPTFGEAECKRLVIRVRPTANINTGTTNVGCLLLTPQGMVRTEGGDDLASGSSSTALKAAEDDGLLVSIRVLKEIIEQDTLNPLVPAASETQALKERQTEEALALARKQQADKVKEELQRLMLGSGSPMPVQSAHSRATATVCPAPLGAPTKNTGASQAIMSLLSRAGTGSAAPQARSEQESSKTTDAHGTSNVIANAVPDQWNEPKLDGRIPTPPADPKTTSGLLYQETSNRRYSTGDSSDDSDYESSEGPCFEDNSEQTDDEQVGNDVPLPTSDGASQPNAGDAPTSKQLKKEKYKAKLKEKKLKAKALQKEQLTAAGTTQSQFAAGKPAYTKIAKRPKEANLEDPSQSLPQVHDMAGNEKNSSFRGRGSFRGRARGGRGRGDTN